MRKIVTLLLAITLPATMVLFARPVSAAIDTTRDCDSVAIITCGSMTQSELQADAKKGDVPTVYANFGISHKELSGFVDGVVWKDGRVTLGTKGNGNLVATNAVTAGRWNNPTSDMTRIPNTDRAYRMSTIHFVDNGQIAFIKMVNNKFAFAVIKTCGNPVTAKPLAAPTPKPTATTTSTATPNLTVVKEVHTQANSLWGKSVTVKPGELVTYHVVGTNVGNTPLQNVTFRDVLPSGITFYTGNPHASLNGQNVSNNLNDGMTIGTLNPGEKFELIYMAATSASENRTDACSTGLMNRAYVAATGLPERSDTALVKVCAPIQPAAVTTVVTPVVTAAAATTPRQLVDTGPGTVFGAVASVMIGGMVAYRYVWLRRTL